jgi:hypothetical protein
MSMIIRKFISIFVGILVIMAWLLGFIIEAQAETMKCKVLRLVTKEETMPVSDEEGHILAMLISEGLAFFENGEIANFKSNVIADRRTGTGKGAQSISYIFFTFEDGSSIITRIEYRSIADPSGKISTKTTGEIIKGTSRLGGIKGTYSSTGKMFPRIKGEAEKYSMDVTLTYTLPPK